MRTTRLVSHRKSVAARLALAAFVISMWAPKVRGDWIIVMPPEIGQRHCEMMYDKSAPIAKWQRQRYGPFETLDACEALRIEIVKRSTAPGRKERSLAIASQRQRETCAADRRLRRDLKDDPGTKSLLRRIPRCRKGVSAVCEVSVDDWSDARCVEHIE